MWSSFDMQDIAAFTIGSSVPIHSSKFILERAR
jgi:hypothetical protein